MTGYDIQGDLNCADFIGGDQNITYGFSAADVERLIEKVLAMMQAGGVFLPAPDQQDALQIEHNGETLRFHPGAARQLANQGQESAYLLSLTVDQEYQRWATRFVPLAGKMDVRQVIEGLPISFTEFIIPTGEAGLGAQPTQRPLKDITEAMNNHGAFVILGEPGAGKTTTMQKVAFETARGLLGRERRRTPLFVRLSQQGEREPYAFLQVEWERRTGKPFAQALREGRILILADGINEIPRDKRSERLNAWMLFEAQYRGANQLIFSGRDKDYDNQLNLPRVLVEPLDEERVQEFLQKHKAEGLADLLNDPASKLDEMARNPLNLFVLVMVYLRGGSNLQVLANRGRLFQSFTRELIAHEQLWHPDPTLSVEAKIELFARLAYEMQKQGSGTTFAIDLAKGVLPQQTQTAFGEQVNVDHDALLRFGRGASIFDPATLPDIRFYHHLLQEYFAARELLRRFNAGEDLSAFWKAPRAKEEMPAEDVGEWDPLPEPPTTGWEMTAILACGLSASPASLIEAVRPHNPALAGRCLDEAGFQTDGMEVKQAVRTDLLSDLYNPKLHLRARLQAGFVLGCIGDPRFETEEINGVKVILPQMVNIPAGSYVIGSMEGEEDSYDDEKPQHIVELPAFSIGKWSVTNAEFACFISANGYENRKFWKTDSALGWLDSNFDLEKDKQLEIIWDFLRIDINTIDRLETLGNYLIDDNDALLYLKSLNDEKIKQLFKIVSNRPRNIPLYWGDSSFNNPSQPVIGITWFEANAYCEWLSDLTNEKYELLTENEWEASSRGRDANIYPWGNVWSKLSANTIDNRILKTSPVGLFECGNGLSIYGAADQCGNVWEWTNSTYSDYLAPSDINNNFEKYVVRGGSWHSIRRYARSACRDGFLPFVSGNVVGFRIAKK